MFDTPLALCGPLRRPRQMLQAQEYGGHASIHDENMAHGLGFKGAPIEGPTHFSQFSPLFGKLWGQAWFEQGCFSAHYQNMVVDGEEVRAFAEYLSDGKNQARAWMEKADGSIVLEASASLRVGAGKTMLEQRMEQLRRPDQLVILADLEVGMTGAEDEIVRMEPDLKMGALYPFSLNDKLRVITENSPWYSDASASPWRRPIIPLEMVSVLAQYTGTKAKFPVKGPAISLFADQEIRMIQGPLFVGETYRIRREIVALSESRRTESYWVRTDIFKEDGDGLVAQMLLNHATLKESYASYEADRRIALNETH